MRVELLIRERQAVLRMAGRFDFSLHRDFLDCCQRALAEPAVTSIEIDLARAEYLDSSALGMLVLLRERAQGAGKHPVRLTGSAGLVRRVLDVANFGRLFTIEPVAQEAP